MDGCLPCRGCATHIPTWDGISLNAPAGQLGVHHIEATRAPPRLFSKQERNVTRTLPATWTSALSTRMRVFGWRPPRIEPRLGAESTGWASTPTPLFGAACARAAARASAHLLTEPHRRRSQHPPPQACPCKTLQSDSGTHRTTSQIAARPRRLLPKRYLAGSHTQLDGVPDRSPPLAQAGCLSGGSPS